MSKRIEPTPAQGRSRYPDADPEALAWIVERAREIVRSGQGGAVGWEWLQDPAPEGEEDRPVAPLARVRPLTVGSKMVPPEYHFRGYSPGEYP
jgi:hypothetical protein